MRSIAFVVITLQILLKISSQQLIHLSITGDKPKAVMVESDESLEAIEGYDIKKVI